MTLTHPLTLALVLASSSGAQQVVDFNRDVRPILSDRCFRCHGPDAGSREAGLRLDRREDALAVIVPRDPESSELMRRVLHPDPHERMPPLEAKLSAVSAAEQAVLRRWIESGAAYEPHWAYARIERPTVSAAAHPIDAFLGVARRDVGLMPAPAADSTTLVRRLTFDLLGLPARPSDVLAFERDRAPDRYERLVDRLLASPRHAERMAVHWLDLVRYADTVGYHGDQEHNISPYRDYVLRAFRDNMPFDRFTREQLAGDLLPEATEEQRIASGYNRLLQTSHEGGVQPGEYLAKYSSDRVRNLGAVWLGSTTGCAECHDHKFDPITQRDFYELAAFFADVTEVGDFKGAKNSSPTQRPPELAVVTELDRERARASGVEAKPRQTMITVACAPRTVRVLPRGNWLDDSGAVVEPAVPHFLPQLATSVARATRLDLARWLTSRDNPLTARVFVNRLWAMLFGRGLSRVLDDVGSQGEPPAHPELLDWLACEFVDSGWNVRHVLRLIVTSGAYRQSSAPSDEARRLDPTNRWFARQDRRRLPAEMIRDRALAVSGLLVHRFGGPSVKPYQPIGYYAHLNFPRRKYRRGEGPDLYRRSVYSHWQRQFLHPVLLAFDAPTREECTAERPSSNSPAAALALLNAPEFVEAARGFAERILDAEREDLARLRWGWREALLRDPDPPELDVLARLLARRRDEFAADESSARRFIHVGESKPGPHAVGELAAWTAVARVVLNLDEGTRRR